MFKYAKITDEKTGLVEIGEGTNHAFYISIGMTQLDVQQSDIDNKWYLAEKCPMKSDEEKEHEEKTRIANLKLTKREVFLGLYKSKGITPETLKAQITSPEALIEFEYANDYYRGNPLISAIGATLGITEKQLDEFFETNDYTKLTENFEDNVDNSETEEAEEADTENVSEK